METQRKVSKKVVGEVFHLKYRGKKYPIRRVIYSRNETPDVLEISYVSSEKLNDIIGHDMDSVVGSLRNKALKLDKEIHFFYPEKGLSSTESDYIKQVLGQNYTDFTIVKVL